MPQRGSVWQNVFQTRAPEVPSMRGSLGQVSPSPGAFFWPGSRSPRTAPPSARARDAYHRPHEPSSEVFLTGALGCSRHWGGNAGGGTDDDCAASFGGATLRAFLRGGGETGPDRGGDDVVCMMSCSAACSAAMFWAICSCLAASCSTVFRITARSSSPRST
jgi:hypothetical protein